MTNEQAKRITKVVAWLLVALMIVALVSGWGITRTEIIYQASRGLIDRGQPMQFIGVFRYRLPPFS